MKDNLHNERDYRGAPYNEGRRPAAGLSALKRISWGAVFAGLVVAMVLQLTLSLLGLGIGIGTINPVEEQNPASGLGTGALIWWIVSMLISLFAGGWVAGRLAGMPTGFDSILHGILTWSLFTLLSFYLLTTAVGSLISGVGSVVGRTLSLAGQGIAAVAPQAAEAIQSSTGGSGGVDLQAVKQEARQILQQTGKPELQPDNIEQQARSAGSTVEGAAGEAASDPQAAGSTFDEVMDRLYGQGADIANAADRDAAVNVIMQRTGKSREEANEVVNSWVSTYEQAKAQYKETRAQVGQRAQQIGGDVASAISKAAIYAFFGLLLGAIAAAVGGKVGEPHDLAVTSNDAVRPV
ncbi:hypothetical protein ACFSKU_13520 [Pontibacter silvestris]|uniref:PhnA-like protein n=1 Tax=Pontibacter silvestris TaxID=2305183 RepID=A0ABW4WYT3_9BACT|nr:hypothetical protein [Pontibacter silvestris]MCC9135532.1 hypothetical protein [Pontibacter silvestris]